MAGLFAQDTATAAGDGVLIANQYLDIIVQGIVIVLGVVFSYLGKLAVSKAKKAGLDEEIIDALATSVTGIYHDFAREAKEAVKDGKIDKKEAARFRGLAIDRAKDILTGPAKDYLIGKGKAWASAKIEDIISAKKGR